MPTPATGVSFFALDASITLLAVSVALLFARPASQWFGGFARRFGEFSRNRQRAVCITALAALFLRLAILPVSPPPQPYFHDEFSYLLASDTFASGRLTNPTPPMWKHFESFHIEMFPSYMSMYFPLQGMAMAFGKIVFGSPWFGILLTSSLMCGAICWMLQGWLPPQWALLGGFFASLRLGAFSYWVDSYYGGAIPALGGALVLGAFPRLLRKPAVLPGLALASGMVILANSRAYEGFLLCAPVTLALIWTAIKGKRLATFARAMALPVSLLLCCALLTGYYNNRVYGSPLKLAYQVNRARYAAVPVFLWQKPYPIPQYRHKVMRDFYLGWELRVFTEARSVSGFMVAIGQKIGGGVLFFFGLALIPPLFFLGRVLRDRRVRPVILLLLIFSVGLAGNPWFMPHYVAPFTAALYLILLQGMRHMRFWHGRTGPYGQALLRLTPALCICLFALRLTAAPLHLGMSLFPMMWFGSEPTGLPRAKVVRQLESLPGKQLALVRYAPNHVSFNEWVYNAADIDASKVIWAREMDPASDGELFAHYPDRQVWLVEPDANPPRVTALPRYARTQEASDSHASLVP